VPQGELWLDPLWGPAAGSLSLIALAMTAALLLRLRLPLAALALQLGLLQIGGRVDAVDGNDPMSLIIIVMGASYSAGAHARGWSLSAAAGLLAASTVTALFQDGESLNVSGLLFFGFFFFAPFLAGLAIRIRRDRESLLVRERDERARAAVAEERARIARELHDVVAHAISVIVLQARGARHAGGAEREAALDAIESTGAKALAEMRRLLHMLRDDDEGADLAPQPSVLALGQLVEQVRDAGLPVELRVEGDPRELPPGVDVSSYRIVQEALTNALKHAGPARAEVRIRYAADGLELEITDTGTGGAATNGDGHGLTGMRERVAVFGGELASGPRDGGGFAVKARLPL
jgi:signal transduction histidine kinase